MSNLLKSKFLLGVLAVVVMFAFAGSVLAADGAITLTLKKGMKNVQVKYLQQTLNEKGFTVATTGAGSAGSETTYFGPATVTATKKFQAAMGLVADGIFGAKSRAALSGTVVTTFPAGCTSAVGFSPTTGLPCNGTVVSNPTGPVAVMLATDNPAAGTLVAGQATADLAHFTFTGAGTVTGLTLQRIGVSADTTPSNIYLFDGATRLTDAASVTSNGTVTFNIPAGIFTVAGSKTISVKSDITTGTSGQTVGITLVSFSTSAGTITANLSGNIHNIATATLATVSAGTVTPSGATINPAAGVTLWQSTLTISNRDVLMKRLALRQVGSASASAFQNFKLYVNGVQVATATGVNADGYVTFDMSTAPVTLVAGSRIVRVDADVVSGASRTVQLSLRRAADVDFVDSSFGVNITPTSTPWASGSANTISGTSGGSLTVEKDVSSPSTNLTLSGSDVNLGTFKLTAYGESIKVETLTAGGTFNGALGSTNDAAVTLRNGRLLINGVQYGSTATLLPAGTSFTVNYTVVPGTPVLVEVHADIYDNDGTGALDASDTILAKLILGSLNATRVDSLGSFNVPDATVSANTLTVATTAVTLTKNGTYPNQTTTLPATGFKIGAWNLAGSSIEDVLLTTLSLDVDNVAVSANDFTAADITNMYVVIKSGSTIVAQPSPLATVAAADNTFSINYTLAKNASVTLELYGNLGSTVTAGEKIKTDLTITGTSLVSGQSVTATSADTDGQTITYGAATITATRDSSSPVAAIVYDEQTVTSAAFKFAAVNSAFNVTDLTFTLPAAGATVAETVDLYDGATKIASQPGGSATVTFSGISWNVPSNTNKVLTVKLVLGKIGSGYGTTNASLLTTLTGFTATSTSTGVADASASDAGPSIENDPAGLAINAFAAIPTITQGTLASNQLLNTTLRPLLKFTMTGNGGDIAWGYLTFKVEKVSDITVGTAAATGYALYDLSNNTAVGGTFTGDATVYGAGTAGDILFVPTAEQTVSGSKGYELRATIGTATTAGDYVTVTLDNDSSAIVASDQLTDIDADTDAPIIWSDMSAASHATTTDDWTSDFGIKNLPISDTLTSPL